MTIEEQYITVKVPTDRECLVTKYTSKVNGSVFYNVSAYSRQKSFTPEAYEEWINQKYWSFNDLK